MGPIRLSARRTSLERSSRGEAKGANREKEDREQAPGRGPIAQGWKNQEATINADFAAVRDRREITTPVDSRSIGTHLSTCRVVNQSSHTVYSSLYYIAVCA